MSSKHTPGPWQVGFADGSGHSYITDSQGRVVVRGGYDSHGIKHGVVKKSDARLTASAPELLSELEMLSNIVEGCGLATMPEVECRLVFARAAIAKATGGAQ